MGCNAVHAALPVSPLTTILRRPYYNEQITWCVFGFYGNAALLQTQGVRQFLMQKRFRLTGIAQARRSLPCKPIIAFWMTLPV
jgi:hypothetical protein